MRSSQPEDRQITKPLTETVLVVRYLVGLLVVAVVMMAGSVVEAHEGVGGADGLWSGFIHPLFGIDHLIAMVAVGLWGAFLGAPAIWLLPVVFPVVMAFAGLVGMSGVPLPGAEIGIAASAIVIGLLVAMQKRLVNWQAAIIVGAFAIFHGHAHGVELPEAASPLAYSAGFVVATGLLHLAGIGIGTLVRWPAGRIAVRGTGALIAAGGLAFLTGIA